METHHNKGVNDEKATPIKRLPMKVAFYVCMENMKAIEGSGEEMLRRKASESCYLHFGGNVPYLWVMPDGTLRFKVSLFRRIRCYREEVFDLQINFSKEETLYNALKLPGRAGRISLRDSEALRHPWKLCLTWIDSPQYLDHIIFHEGEFKIESVFFKFEEGKLNGRRSDFS